jgi:hypothetical protein
MSPLQISRSPDLQRLRDEGFNIEIRAAYLFVHDVPYVTDAGEVAYGTIVSELTTNGVNTVTPTDHTVCFVGGIPHDIHGAPLSKFINNPNPVTLADGVVAQCQFSSKPPTGAYADYYEKISSYVNMVSGAAQAIDPHATAKTFPVAPTTAEESVFRYHDAASSRARISAVTEKLAMPKVAIVGLGGTGGYILDQVAKTPVGEIHLYDPDRFYAHNAFRSPGAASIDQLTQSPLKVNYYKSIYDAIRYGIVAHAERVDANNIAQLQSMSFVFLAIDSGPCRKFIAEHLQAHCVPFTDCGIGVYRTGESLAGIIRTTTCTPERQELQRLPVVTMTTTSTTTSKSQTSTHSTQSTLSSNGRSSSVSTPTSNKSITVRTPSTATISATRIGPSETDGAYARVRRVHPAPAARRCALRFDAVLHRGAQVRMRMRQQGRHPHLTGRLADPVRRRGAVTVPVGGQLGIPLQSPLLDQIQPRCLGEALDTWTDQRRARPRRSRTRGVFRPAKRPPSVRPTAAGDCNQRAWLSALARSDFEMVAATVVALTQPPRQENRNDAVHRRLVVRMVRRHHRSAHGRVGVAPKRVLLRIPIRLPA